MNDRQAAVAAGGKRAESAVGPHALSYEGERKVRCAARPNRTRTHLGTLAACPRLYPK